jgi:hypothetical protein
MIMVITGKAKLQKTSESTAAAAVHVKRDPSDQATPSAETNKDVIQRWISY